MTKKEIATEFVNASSLSERSRNTAIERIVSRPKERLEAIYADWKNGKFDANFVVSVLSGILVNSK